MPAIRIKHKNRVVQLGNGSAWRMNVGVYFGDGTIQKYKWLGFVEREYARIRPNAMPVNLDIASYSYENMPQNWTDVPEGYAVWGCLVSEGVFAVLDGGKFRFIESW